MATNEEDQKKCIQQLKEWINLQPHLPNDIDDILLLRFSHSCYNDFEKAKKAMDTFFTVRSSLSDLLKNRDPDSEHIQKILKVIDVGQYSISGNRSLWAYQVNDPGLEIYDYLLDVKLFFLTTDARFMENDALTEEDIVMVDVKDISLKFLTKIHLSVAKKLERYQEEAMPIRLKQIHVLNASPVIDKIFGVMKAFMKKDLTERIHFHTPNSKTLFKYFSKDDLPVDFGGTLAPLAERKEKTIDVLNRHREKLMDENLWQIVDKKKNNISTETASFRTLVID